MKKWLFISYLLLFTNLIGCTTLKKVTQIPTQIKSTIFGPPILSPYSGPKAKIAIADFELKTLKATNEIGSSLRQMLIAALIDTNRFSIVERRALSASTQDKEANSYLILTAALTEFEPQTSGGKAGIGGGGGMGSGVFGGLLTAASNKAQLALDIRLISTPNSKVLMTKRISGQASDTEKVTRLCIIETVRYVSRAIPENYYKY